MLFVVHALDKKDILPTRAKHYRDHRIHLDKSGDHGVDGIRIVRERLVAQRSHDRRSPPRHVPPLT